MNRPLTRSSISGDLEKLIVVLVTRVIRTKRERFSFLRLHPSLAHRMLVWIEMAVVL
jgi:hypothetical protein